MRWRFLNGSGYSEYKKKIETWDPEIKELEKTTIIDIGERERLKQKWKIAMSLAKRIRFYKR